MASGNLRRPERKIADTGSSDDILRFELVTGELRRIDRYQLGIDHLRNDRCHSRGRPACLDGTFYRADQLFELLTTKVRRQIECHCKRKRRRSLRRFFSELDDE